MIGPGRTISHYRILEHLGSGGMGQVFKAEDLNIKRTVALKFLPPQATRDVAAETRFAHEAQAASELDHPNICPIYELAKTDEGESYIVMPCYAGQTLGAMVERGPLPLPIAERIALQLATGLAEAHRHGIIHRDVTPSNVLVTDEGAVKILDFGLAWLTGRPAVTRPGHTVGTLAYMSPEALNGSQVDARTDIWSFGVTVYQMLTGRLPFRGDHPESLMYSILYEDPQEIDRPDTPEPLRELCARCLQKDRTARPVSMEQVLDVLESSPDAPRRKRSAPFRWPTFGRWIGAGLALGAAMLIGWFVFFDHPGPSATGGRARIAVLPFRSPGGDSVVSQIAQDGQAMLASEFIGVDWLGVVDPLSLNGLIESAVGAVPGPPTDLSRVLRRRDIDFVLAAVLTRTPSGFRVHMDVIDPSHEPPEVAYAWSGTGAAASDIPGMIGDAAGRILDFLEVRILHESQERDLRPWLTYRKPSIAALKAFSRAWESMYNADYDEARRSLRLAIGLDSQFVSPRIWLIPDLVSGGLDSEAHAQYQYLEALGPEASPFERAMIGWAGAYIRHDLPRQAACLELALEYSPRSNLLLGNLAYTRYLTNDIEGALNALEPCLESRWRYPPVYPLAAVCFMKTSRFTEAKKALENSLALTPIDPRTYSLLAALALRDRDTVAAGRYGDRFMRLMLAAGRSRAYADALQGDHYVLAAMFGRAAECYADAVRRSGDVPAHREKLADALYRAGQRTTAWQAVAEGLRLFPGSAPLHFLAARISDDRRDTSAALAEYRWCAAHGSGSVDSVFVMSRLKALQP